MATDETPAILEEARRSAQKISAIEQLAADLSDVDKLELIARLAHSVRFKRQHDDEVAVLRRRNMMKFLEELDEMPLASEPDRSPEQTHDEVLYGSPR